MSELDVKGDFNSKSCTTLPSPNAVSRLIEAVSKLKNFSEKNSARIENSPFSRTMGFVRNLWKQAVKKSDGEDSQNEELLEAVEVVNRERLSIQKMQLGSHDEKRMAEVLLSAIDSYNRHTQKFQGENRGVLNRFLSEKLVTVQDLPKIHVPQTFKVTYHYSQNQDQNRAKPALENCVDQPNSNVLQPLSSVLSQRSADLFRMKVLSLLERYGIASNPEARNQVRSCPIQSRVETEDGAMCTLSQKLSLFPGQTIVVMGKSSLDYKSKLINRIFPETFSISLESSQTAFPHPSQRAGWSLVNDLIPEFPQRLDLLTEASSLFLEKRDIRLRLQPEGDLIAKAKRILRVKRKAFLQRQKHLIELHEELARAILESSSKELHSKFNREAALAWFSYLKDQEYSFDLIVEANEICCEQFISKPFHKLHDAIINGKDTPFGSQDAQERFEAARSFLEDALVRSLQENSANISVEEGNKWNYILCMGELLGRASHSIFLQHLSEDLIFAPKVLSVFEAQIQQAAYDAVEDFIDELKTYPDSTDEINLNWCHSRLEKYLQNDIAIFRGIRRGVLTDELHRYFNLRYSSLSTI